MIFFVEIKFKYETKLTKYLWNAFLPYNATVSGSLSCLCCPWLGSDIIGESALFTSPGLIQYELARSLRSLARNNVLQFMS